MMRIDAGRTARYCDGASRRSFLQLGVAGMASVSLSTILRAREASAAAGGKKDNAVILLWLDGGPSHMDLYDMKPNAPAEYRGIWKPIKTNVPGIEITELFPKQARIADKFSILRSLHHDTGDHFAGGHYMLTSRGGASGGSTPGRYPSIGSIVAKMRGANRFGMPAYVGVPYAMSIGLRPGYFGANYLGAEFNPFETGGDPNTPGFRIDNLNFASGTSIDSLEDRRGLLARFDSLRREVDRSGMVDAMDRFQREAYEMVSGPAARKAFDLSGENPRLRDEYGRNSWGQSTLLARRLVEAGSTFVTAHFGGWDHHWDLKAGMQNYLPMVDLAVSALLRDLDTRGLLEKTLVVLCGEFSRTPRMNNGGNGGAPMSMGTPGRDHWGNSMFCFFAGGGLKMGQVIGSTDAKGESPKTRPYVPANVHATIYKVLGIDPSQHFLDHAGRPTPILDIREPVSELL